MIDRADIRAIWDFLLPFTPPVLGAFIGLRYSLDQTPKQRVLSFLTASILAVYLGPATGEVLGLSSNATAAVTLIEAAIGTELVAAMVNAARRFAGDPLEVFRKVFNTIRGRSEP
jgi:hypothetical protein